MNLYLRLLCVLIASLFRKRITDILSPSFLTFHVMPHDLDANIHMNNGRYLTLMDLGRIDLILRTGLLKVALRNGYLPVLASAIMRYRLPLGPFQRFRLETRILCWDEKWVYLEQRFILARGPKQGAVAAIGIVKGSLWNKHTKQTVPSSELLKAVGFDRESPPLPSYVIDWQKAEDSVKALTAPP